MLIINAWSSSLPLFHYFSIYLSFHSLSDSFSLSLSPLRSLCLSLYLNTLNQSNNGQKNRTCLFLLLLLSPSLQILSFSPSLSLSLSLPFSLCSLVSSCPWFVSKSSISCEEGEKETEATEICCCCSVSWLAVQSVRQVVSQSDVRAALGSVLWLL